MSMRRHIPVPGPAPKVPPPAPRNLGECAHPLGLDWLKERPARQSRPKGTWSVFRPTVPSHALDREALDRAVRSDRDAHTGGADLEVHHAPRLTRRLV